MGKHDEAFAQAEQDKDLTTIGGRIRYARKLRMLTQEELAKEFPGKRGRAVISEYEKNNITPPLDVIEALATILGEDPAYLAFGMGPERVAQAVNGQLIPIGPAVDDEDEEQAILPSWLLASLASREGALRLLNVEVPAPAHGLASGDYVLVNTSRPIASDGRLYAVRSSAGLAVMRSEPVLQNSPGADLYLISGRGLGLAVPSDAISVQGLVVASLQRRS